MSEHLVLAEFEHDCLRLRISSGAGLPLRFLSDGNFSIGIHGENSFLSSDLQLGIFLNYLYDLRKAYEELMRPSGWTFDFPAQGRLFK